MLDQLPQYIDPVHLADKRGELHGQIPLNSLPRLAELLVDTQGAVTVDLYFGREGRLPTIEGQVQAVLQVRCQSCLQAIETRIDKPVKLGMVHTLDQANKLAEDYDPLLVGDEKLPLKDIVEDELLLALPDYPKHDYDCFDFHLSKHVDRPDSNPADDILKTENPFAILTKLKN